MGLALLVWVGDGLLKGVSNFFGNESSLGRKSAILHLPQIFSLTKILYLYIYFIISF